MKVVLASMLIPAGAKLVWLQDWLCDAKGQGCWLTNAQMGERLGMSERTVEGHRLALADGGLHERIPPGRSVVRFWRSVVPEYAKLSSANPTADTIIRHRVKLDDELRQWPPAIPRDRVE